MKARKRKRQKKSFLKKEKESFQKKMKKKKETKEISLYGKLVKKMNRFGNQNGGRGDPDGILSVQLCLAQFSEIN